MANILTDEANAVRLHNIAHPDSPLPLPTVYLRQQPSTVKTLADQARQAVAGYSSTNGTRKAVEALADAIENNL